MFPEPMRPTPMKATFTLSLAPRMLPVKKDEVSAAAPAVLRNWRRSVDSCAIEPVVAGLAVDWRPGAGGPLRRRPSGVSAGCPPTHSPPAKGRLRPACRILHYWGTETAGETLCHHRPPVLHRQFHLHLQPRPGITGANS